MPYKNQTLKLLIPKELNRRVKLTTQDKDSIRESYKLGHTSQRALASLYNVSRRLIQFVLSPDKYEESKRIRNTRHTRYYNKEKQKEYIKKVRHYRQELYKEDKLI
jgi:hypothetical protein